MLNREKYAKEIIEIACNGGNIAVVNGKLKEYEDVDEKETLGDGMQENE